MKRRFTSRSLPPPRRQPTSLELRDDLLGFLQRKFYQGEAVAFAKDRSKLLDWVVLWPASWLDEKEVTIPGDKYRSVFMSVFMDAGIHGTSKIKYRPAWLREVIQSYFRIHGEELYNEAKSARSLVENAMLLAGQIRQQTAPDPVRQLAEARALLVASKPTKKQPHKQQLPLL